MSRLTPGLLALDKGLNLQAPKIMAPAGSVNDSLNYEQVDFQGQKRIDGFARYDGGTLAAQDDFLLVDSPTVGDNYNVFNGSRPYGIELGVTDEGASIIAVYDETAMPESGQWARNVIADPQEHQTFVVRWNNYIRNNVQSLPDVILGLHWFRDKLYAVAGIESSYDPHTARGLPAVAGSMSTIWESWSERQTLDDGSTGWKGWEFKHLGWAVPFEEGNSPYGKLVSLNQNRQGVGIEGPTSIAGENGRPRVLTQKVDITNLPAQVAGWKTSTSPTVYNLEDEAVNESGDDYYIYADAYFYWEEEENVVSAPGITMQGLVEYSPTAAIEIGTEGEGGEEEEGEEE